MAYVHIYCGEGKGKTTAALGLALRMAGCGKQAVIVRFLKNDASGEIRALKSVPGITVIPCERSFGFSWRMTEAEKREAAAYYEELFDAAVREAVRAGNRAPEEQAAGTVRDAAESEISKAPPSVLLVLDEACAALEAGLLPLNRVTAFLDERPEQVEVVITGRRPCGELLDRADYITEMRKLRHPFDEGLRARRGIEY